MRTNMINIDEAKVLANKKLKEIEEKSRLNLAMLEAETTEFEFGWMFFYQSKEFVETGNLNSLVGGNAPIIVDKYNSSIHLAGTGKDFTFYIKKYCEFRDDIDKYKKEILR